MKSQIQWIIIEFKCFFRSFVTVFFTLIFPPLFLLLFGEIYGNEPSPLFDGLGSMDASLPAYICMIVCVTGIMSLPLSLISYRENKILKRFKATPTTPTQIIVAQIVVNLLMTLVGTILLVIIARLRYSAILPENVLNVAIAFLLGILCVFSIGFVIASVIDNARAATAVANVVYFPMLFLSGATIPLETMPDAVQDISQFIPLTHVVQIMKGAWSGAPLSDFGGQIFILLAIASVCTTVSIFSFKWDSDNV